MTPTQNSKSTTVTAVLRLFKWQSAALMSLLGAHALLEAVGVGSLLPLLSLALAHPSGQHGIIHEIFTWSGAVDQNSQLRILGTLIILLFMTRMAVNLLKEYYSSKFTSMLRDFWSTRIFGNFIFGKNHAGSTSKPGTLINQMISEPVHAAAGVNDFIEVTMSALLMASLTAFLMLLNWRVTSVLLIILAVTAGLLWNISTRFSRSMGQNRSKLSRDVSQVIAESANGIRQIKICGNEDEVFAELHSKQNALLSMIDRFAAVRSAPKEVGEFAVMCAIVLCLFWGALVQSDNLPSLLPEIAVFSVAFMKLFIAASHLLKKQMGFASNWPAIQSVQSLADYASLTAGPANSGPVTFTKSIVAKDLTFNFGNNTPILRNANFEIRKGEITALIGKTGVGKSTLCDLLAKLAVPDSGKILVDGVDLNTIATAKWREKIGYVSQDVFLFNTTVANNILMGCKNPTRGKAIKAAELADAQGFIEALPLGFDTIIGTGGLSLSGGQKQRVALAQALARDPELLILDEMTSGLDDESEARIWQTLVRESKNRAIRIVSHRIKKVKNGHPTVTELLFENFLKQ